jgi:hypothetical protein
MTNHYLLNHFAALGHVGSYKHWSWSEYRDQPAPPRNLARYLASRRRYGNVEVQPVLIPQAPGSSPLAGSLAYEHEWGSVSTGRYQVTLHTTSVDLLDVIHSAMAMLKRAEDDDALVLIPVEVSDVPEARVLTSNAFDELARRRLPLHSAQTAPLISFNLAASNDMHFDDFLWRLCDRLSTNPALVRSALYLRSAIRNVYLIYGPVDDYHELFEEMPSPLREQVRIESSIQDCLKAVETLYGGMLPTNNDNRVAARLKSLGVDPSERCGFSRHPYKQATILKKLLALRDARNRGAAHGGSAAQRLNSLYDLCDYQHLASTILWGVVCKGEERLLTGRPLEKPLVLDETLLSPRLRRRLAAVIKKAATDSS